MTLSSFYRTTIVALLHLVIGALVFRDFVFGNLILLYKDIGSDSLNGYYPLLVHLSQQIHGTGLTMWSFGIGMGQSLFPIFGSLVLDPVVWFPARLIAPLLVYDHLLKVVIAGTLFYRFLDLRGLGFRASMLGSLFLSLSAYLCNGSCWMVIGNEVVPFTFLLFAAENAVTRGRWIYLPLAVASVALLTPVHLYLAALLLGLYVPGRLFELHGWSLVRNFRRSTQLAAAGLIGIGLSAPVWIAGGHMIFNSPRGSGFTSYAGGLRAFPILGFENRVHYVTAVCRLFSNDLVGTGSSFVGWQNYLEAPMSYAGLLCPLLLPQVFIGANRRQRILYAVCLALIALPVVLPWFRYLFWLFQGDYYRALSLSSVFAMIALSMTAFSHYVRDRTLNVWLLGATVIVALGVLYLPPTGTETLIQPEIRRLIVFGLSAYAILLIGGRLFKRESISAWLIVVLSVAELCVFDRITVAGSRSTVTKQELKERIGYNDRTVDAVRDITASDQNFYRITKLYHSSPAVWGPVWGAGLNDALVFGYYGTSSYNSFNNLNYIKFLIALDVIPSNPTEHDTRYPRGLIGLPAALTFACEKYILTTEPVPLQLGSAYEQLNRYDNIYVFRNKRYLPFGLFYSSYLPEESFSNLPASKKQSALLRTVVLSDKDVSSATELTRMNGEALSNSPENTEIESLVAEHRANALRIQSLAQDHIQGMTQSQGPGILVFQTAFDSGWQASVDDQSVAPLKVDIGLLGVKVPAGQHKVEMTYRPPFLWIGMLMTALSLLIFLFSWWRWPALQNFASRG